jgi:hypothetical protein
MLHQALLFISSDPCWLSTQPKATISWGRSRFPYTPVRPAAGIWPGKRQLPRVSLGSFRSLAWLGTLATARVFEC